MNLYRCLAISFMIAVCVKGCVSPFYGTARIEEGLKMNAGVGAATFVDMTEDSLPYCIGLRGDYQLSYAFSRYLQANARAGLGGGFVIPAESEVPVPSSRFRPLVAGALGLQVSIPSKVTPAFGVDLSFPQVSSSLMLGFGDPEWLTVGGRLNMPYTGDDVDASWFEAFATMHTANDWFISGGFGAPISAPILLLFQPLATLGIGLRIK